MRKIGKRKHEYREIVPSILEAKANVGVIIQARETTGVSACRV